MRSASLSRNVSRELRNIQQLPGRQRVVVRLRDYFWSMPSLLRSVSLPLLVLASAIAALFLPVPLFYAALATDSPARDFLNQLWQVSGASVGLSIAVVVFAFQGISSGNLVATLQDYAVRAPLLAVVYLGISSLIVDALVLLGVGYGAPAQWAATWAVDLSGLSIVSVAFLFAVALRSIDPQFLRRRRIRAIHRQAAFSVRQDARVRIGLNLLFRDADEQYFEFSPLSISNASGALVVQARAVGEVRDIRIRQLRKLATACQKMNAVKPVLFAYPGRVVSLNTTIITIPAGRPDLLKRARKVAIVRSARWQPKINLEHHAQQLHDEAVRAISTSSLLAYGQAVEAQRELLLALPRMWHILGRNFDADIATGIFLMSQSPVSRVRRNLYEQVMRAVADGEREIALDAGYTPINVAKEALELRAVGLSGEMMGLLRSIASIGPVSQLSQLLREHVLLNLYSYTEFVIAPRLTGAGLTEDQRLEAAEFMEQALDAMIDIARDAVESRSLDFFREVDRQWRQVLEFWLQEELPSYRPDSPSKRLATRIETVRTRLYASLGAWVFYRLWEDLHESELREMLQITLSYYSSATEALHAGEIIQARGRSDKLSQWLMSEMSTGPAQIIDSTTPLYRFIALILLREGCSGDFVIEETPWLLSAHHALSHELGTLSAHLDIGSLAGSDDCDLDEARSAAETALSAAVGRQRQKYERALVAATVTMQARGAFSRGVSLGWEERRSGMAMLRITGGQIRQNVGPEPITRLGFTPELIGKQVAVEGDFESSLKRLGEQYGRRLASGETRQIAEQLEQRSPVHEAEAQNLNERVLHALDELREEGYSPRLLIVGADWRTQAELSLLSVPADYPLDRRVRDVLGLVDDVLVIRLTELAPASVILVDCSRWGGLYEWTDPEGTAIEAKLQDYTELEATELIRSEPTLFADISEPTIENRAFELRKHIRIDVFARVEVRVDDARAARRIRR